jgi:hypothetical protein
VDVGSEIIAKMEVHKYILSPYVGHIHNMRTAKNLGKCDEVLAIGPKVRGFKPDRGRWIFKIRSTTSFGGQVKPWPPCRKILRHVKEPYGV